MICLHAFCHGQADWLQSMRGTKFSGLREEIEDVAGINRGEPWPVLEHSMLFLHEVPPRKEDSDAGAQKEGDGQQAPRYNANPAGAIAFAWRDLNGHAHQYMKKCQWASSCRLSAK